MEYNVEDAIKVVFDGKDAHNWKPEVKMTLITKEIENVKIDIRNYVKESDADVDDILRECRELCAESQELIEEMEACKHGIEEETMAEVLKSIENHDYIIEELATVQFSINAICSIVTCGRLAREFEEHNNHKNYHRAMETILELLEILENPVSHHTVLSMCVNFKNSATIAYENLLEFLYSLWYQMVTWETKISDSGVNTITININMSDSEATFDALYALLLCKKLHYKVKEFSVFLLEEVLIPIINQECTVNTNTDESITITVKTKSSKKPGYDRVFRNIRELFNQLSNKLKIELPDDETVMKIIGKDICDDFSNILVKECLIDTIPHNINELQSYGIITSEIENFQQFLTVLNFFPNENFSILQYINNIDMLFAEKTSQHFLETARAIMLKDLSSTMSIGVETIPDDTPTTSTPDENWEEALQVFNTTLPKSLFYFPRCMISKTAQELLDLVYTMMEQAVQCSDVVCKRLYLTSRLVFELYDSVVPYHHENFLQNIPQYVALFHNNCMYLSHNLLTLGDKWTTLLEGRKLATTVSYLDLVHKLRDLAHKHLTVHMQQQRKQIMDNIRGCDLNCIVVKDVLSDNAEQAIRQCLRQLQILKNVWIGVFPPNVFTGLMATLVNMFVDEIIHRVCSVEDVSAEMAAQLTDIYTIVVKKAPNLFQNPTDIEERVKCWVKLQELILVLGGSLKDIEKRWAEGKGPLAVHFRTEELRNLIKALFQNTQFRANLLSKIK